MPEYIIRVWFGSTCPGYFYTGQSDNLGATVSASRKESKAVARHEVATCIANIMAKYRDVFKCEFYLL